LDRLSVTNSRFINLDRGITLKGGASAYINENAFKNNNDFKNPGITLSITEGVYSKYHSEFYIKENTFIDSTDNWILYGSNGTVVNNSYSGTVKNNEFKQYGTGLQAEDDNRALLIHCNDFKNNQSGPFNGQDLLINPLNGSNHHKFPDFGNCRHPALSINSSYTSQDPGNHFIPNSDMNIVKGSASPTPPSIGYLDYPVDYSDNPHPPDPNLTNPRGKIYLCGVNSIKDCGGKKDDDPPWGIPSEGVRSEQIEAIGTDKAGLLDSIDNGDTEGTVDTLLNPSTDPTTKENVLWEVTPFASDTVLIFATLECEEIEEEVLKDILIENSPLTKDVMEALENREPSLNEEIMESIQAHQDSSYSKRQILRRHIKHVNAIEQKLINHNMMYYLHHDLLDTLNEEYKYYRDSAQQYLKEDTSFPSRRKLIRSLIEENNIAQAES
jgi:predicted transcriptional regulator